MRYRTVASLLGLVALLVLTSALYVEAQTPACVVSISAHTQNRKVLAPNQGVHISVECSWPHSVPWGIWGVSSNVGGVSGKDQFKGWGEPGSSEHREWNSCTSDYPPINCTYYNDANCTQQITDHGVNTHGGAVITYDVGCPRETSSGEPVMGGCFELDGSTITLYQNFMTLYEKDWPDADDLVQSLYFPNISKTLSGCTVWDCPQQGSSWVTPTFYDTPAWPPLVDAQMAITVRGTLFDSGSCNCEPCDPWPGSCPPCEPDLCLPGGAPCVISEQ